jgi:hypothetical protein
LKRIGAGGGLLLPALAALVLSGCATTAVRDYSALQAAAPRSVLVVPVVNRSVDVNAPDYFLSTLAVPVAERGYYVFPVNLVKRLLEDDGLADADMVHNADTARLCSLFGSDSVLYAAIDRWDARYMVLATQVTVEIDYALKDCRTGDVLWDAHKAMVYEPQTQNTGSPLGNLIAMAVSAAVAKAAPNYMRLAREANAQVFAYPGPGLPAGPYRPEHGKDIPQRRPPESPSRGDGR